MLSTELRAHNRIGQDGWTCPSGLRFPKPALIYPSSTLSRGTQLDRLVTVSKRSEIGQLGEDGHVPRWCPRLESNQHLLRFRQAPSPDRLRGHCCGRGGARPRASSTIRLSEITFVAQRHRSGTRSRTSTNRVKTCRPAVSRSPSCGVPGRGFGQPGTLKGFRPSAREHARRSLDALSRPRHLRSERSGLPLADPGSRGSAGSRTPFARLRAECFAIKASDPHVRLLPPVGLEPTHAGLKGRYPTSWVTAAHVCRRLVCECGSGRTRTCDGRVAQTGLQPASFAARMHAPPSRSRNSFPLA